MKLFRFLRALFLPEETGPAELPPASSEEIPVAFEVPQIEPQPVKRGDVLYTAEGVLVVIGTDEENLVWCKSAHERPRLTGLLLPMVKVLTVSQQEAWAQRVAGILSDDGEVMS